jgi:beta-glucanase (GH16 family)
MTNLTESGFQFVLCAVSILLVGGRGATATVSTPQTATPTISITTTTGAQNGAVVASLSTITSGATIHYTLDGTTPTTSSQVYEAPFLVASNLTVKAIATLSGSTDSSVVTKAFKPNIAPGTLVWSDEFANSTSAKKAPDASVWTYDTGNDSGWGNSELEVYCAYGSTVTPCSRTTLNAYVAPGGGLKIVAEEPSRGVYTSARMKTQGLFSFQYGRVEIKAEVPESQGFWPAFWLMGNNISTIGWPGCGEMDVLERVDAAGSPDWNAGSIHGTGVTGINIGTKYYFPKGQTAATAHTYGMIWRKGSVEYYVDDETKPYATSTPSNFNSFSGSVWPFDTGPNFIILNLAVGGSWPGNPTASTPFPSTMKVDYVRVYAN